ncbi:UDP-N-acetylglucosamine 2-epimerase (hydrolyzing), partial [Candidatus Gottesmanbacteria bacterium]|nr:UDP-N-acetylglucosamine 2-epimerase (hydrolyzing) [Candidatus Gottesmanbacteria bacterium]
MKRKVCVVTGSRAEYGLLRPIIFEINKSKTLELLLMVTSMHLSEEFGKTANLIEKDGLKITYKVEMNPKENTAESMAESIGRGILGITAAFHKKQPDITLLLGDRIEELAGAIVSAYLNIPIAHIHGGDKSKAGLDESARHAITKLSHIHFAATKKSMERILKMGEDPRKVFLVGAPGLDSILKGTFLSKSELSNKFGLDFNRSFLVMLQHSVTTQIAQAGKQIKETLKAIEYLKLPTIAVFPNSDAGGRTIIGEIESKRGLFVEILKNIPRDLYLSLLKHASVLVGNSSGGVIETPSLKIPVVNIGIRQAGRERSTNVIDVPHDKAKIVRAIRKALYDKKFKEQVRRCVSPYGD